MDEVFSYEKLAREMYDASVKVLVDCKVPSHDFDLAMTLIHAYHAYCVRLKSKDNLETKPDCE